MCNGNSSTVGYYLAIYIISFCFVIFLRLVVVYRYDIIFDAAGIPVSDISPYIACLKDWSFAKYITLRSPLLRNTDTYGLIGGMFCNAADLFKPNITSGAFFKGSSFRWGYFMPINKGVKEIARLVESKQVSLEILIIGK